MSVVIDGIQGTDVAVPEKLTRHAIARALGCSVDVLLLLDEGGNTVSDSVLISTKQTYFAFDIGNESISCDGGVSGRRRLSSSGSYCDITSQLVSPRDLGAGGLAASGISTAESTDGGTDGTGSEGTPKDPMLCLLFHYKDLFQRRLKVGQACRTNVTHLVARIEKASSLVETLGSPARAFLQYCYRAFEPYSAEVIDWLDARDKKLAELSERVQKLADELPQGAAAGLQQADAELDALLSKALRPGMLGAAGAGADVPLPKFAGGDSVARVRAAQELLEKSIATAKALRAQLGELSECFESFSIPAPKLDAAKAALPQFDELAEVVGELEQDYSSIYQTSKAMYDLEASTGQVAEPEFDLYSEAQVRSERHPELMKTIERLETLAKQSVNGLRLSMPQWNDERLSRMRMAWRLRNISVSSLSISIENSVSAPKQSFAAAGSGILLEELLLGRRRLGSQLEGLESVVVEAESSQRLPAAMPLLSSELSRRHEFSVCCAALCRRFESQMRAAAQRELAHRRHFEANVWPSLNAALEQGPGATALQLALSQMPEVARAGMLAASSVSLQSGAVHAPASVSRTTSLESEASAASGVSHFDEGSSNGSWDWADALDESEILLARGFVDTPPNSSNGGSIAAASVGELDLVRWLASGNPVSPPVSSQVSPTASPHDVVDVATDAAVDTVDFGTSVEGFPALAAPSLADAATDAASPIVAVDVSTSAGDAAPVLSDASTDTPKVLASDATTLAAVPLADAATSATPSATDAATDADGMVGPPAATTSTMTEGIAVADASTTAVDVGTPHSVTSVDAATTATPTATDAATTATPTATDAGVSAGVGTDDLHDASTSAGTTAPVVADMGTVAGTPTLVDLASHALQDEMALLRSRLSDREREVENLMKMIDLINVESTAENTERATMLRLTKETVAKVEAVLLQCSTGVLRLFPMTVPPRSVLAKPSLSDSISSSGSGSSGAGQNRASLSPAAAKPVAAKPVAAKPVAAKPVDAASLERAARAILKRSTGLMRLIADAGGLDKPRRGSSASGGSGDASLASSRGSDAPVFSGAGGVGSDSSHTQSTQP